VRSHNRQLRIGMTGGIAAGKSTAAGLFSQFNVNIIDADTINIELLKQDAVKDEIARIFGNDIIINGHISTKAVKNRIFSSPSLRSQLETLMHPLIWQSILSTESNDTGCYAIYVIPLLIESSYIDEFDRVLLITRNMHNRVLDLSNKDKIPYQQALNYINAQINNNHRLIYSDDVIVNSNLRNLSNQITVLHNKYTYLSKMKLATQ